MKYKVFISHGSGDKYLANHVREKLGEHGIHSFLDQVDVDIGLNFRTRILQELEDCDELLCLLTPTSIARAWISAEIGAASVLKKTVVAVNCWVRDEELQERGFYSLLGDVAPIVFDDLMDDFDTYVASIRNRIGENNNEQE